MNRKKIERITASLAVFLLLFMTVGAILTIADGVFAWDIFPPHVEKIIGFVMGALGIVIFSCVLVNVMINLSIIAINTSKFLDNHGKK